MREGWITVIPNWARHFARVIRETEKRIKQKREAAQWGGSVRE